MTLRALSRFVILLLEMIEIALHVQLVSDVQDAVEIEQLLNYLIDQEDSEGFILVGHSTGCQVFTL